MTHLRINPRDIKPAIINLIAGSLKVGQVVVLPTDTVYGLSCLADASSAVKKIQRLKQRATDKPFLILVDSLAMLKKYALVSPRQAALLRKLWAASARPTTVILKHRCRLPKELTGESDGLAVRLPKSEFLIKILKAVKKPIVSTSLNLSGRASVKDLKFLLHHFPKKWRRPDLAVDTGKCRRKRVSRLVDLRPVDKPVILRK